MMLAGVLYLYLVFGFYVVHTTGSTAGLESQRMRPLFSSDDELAAGILRGLTP